MNIETRCMQHRAHNIKNNSSDMIFVRVSKMSDVVYIYKEKEKRYRQRSEIDKQLWRVLFALAEQLFIGSRETKQTNTIICLSLSLSVYTYIIVSYFFHDTCLRHVYRVTIYIHLYRRGRFK